MGINLNKIREIENFLFSNSKENTSSIKAKIIELNNIENSQYAQLSIEFCNIICNQFILKKIKLALPMKIWVLI